MRITKRAVRNISILIFPFLMMVLINEAVRPTIEEEPYSVAGVSAMNTIQKKHDQCTWICHNNTNYCKAHHVKYLEPFFPYTDRLYFGAINMLRATGNYGLANIVLLVVVIPFLMWLLLVKSLNIQDEINKIKNGK